MVRNERTEANLNPRALLGYVGRRCGLRAVCVSPGADRCGAERISNGEDLSI